MPPPWRASVSTTERPARQPITVELLNSWTIDARIAWMMNNFETDERYAHAWNIARRAMMAAPIDFPLEIERRWQKRATKTW